MEIWALILKPIDLLHLADDDHDVALVARRPVVIESVAELAVAADHVRRLDVDVRRAVVAGAARAHEARARHVDVAVLGMVHVHGAARDAGRGDNAGRDDAVAVIDLEPVVVLGPDGSGVLLVQEDGLAAAEQREQLL